MTQHKKLDAYFISDIHLRSQGEPNGLILLKFLNQLKIGDLPTHLFLIGDIFDLWVGDHEVFTEAYPDLIFALQELKYKGVEIHYFEGNHDLHLSTFWRDKLDFFVHEDAKIFDLSGLKVRVEHGDQSDPDDTGYLFLRWFLRTLPMRFFIRHCPGVILKKLGNRASATSRDYTSRVKTIDEETSLHKFRNHAMRRSEEEEFDYLIAGHIHIQDEYEFSIDAKKVRSINLGTWLKKPVAYNLKVTGGQFIDL